MISGSVTAFATPSSCSQANTSLSPVSFSMNLEPGTPHCGHFSGGSSPS